MVKLKACVEGCMSFFEKNFILKSDNVSSSLDKLIAALKNINQITIAIRQIKADRKIEDGEYQMVMQELEKYNEKRNEISELLGKHLF